MGKKKSKTLPKRFAGVKIPKAVRKGPVGQFLASKAGKAILAETLMLAGAGLAATQGKEDSATRRMADEAGFRLQGAGKKLKRAGAGGASEAAALLAGALTDAAQRLSSARREARSFAEQESGRGAKPRALVSKTPVGDRVHGWVSHE